MPQTKVTSEGIDRRKRVLEVTTACAEETASNFYTLTCNMSQHLGKKPLFDALNNFTKDADRDIFQSALQSCMGFFVRM